MPGIRGAFATLCFVSAALPVWTGAAEPAPETLQEFHKYIRGTELRLDSQLRGERDFLWAGTPERRLRLRGQTVACEPRIPGGVRRVSRGLIHHWVGAVFVPGATLEQVLTMVQDYDNHKVTYWPEVVASQLLSRSGSDFRVQLRLHKRKGKHTVLLETEHDVRYRQLGQRCWHSRSRSTRIVEFNARTGRAAAKDRGFLWRLNSYWTFRELDGGCYVECEAVSLTRSVPRPFAWLLNPLVRTLPREALIDTLTTTRGAVTKGKHVQQPDASVTNRLRRTSRLEASGRTFAWP